MTAVPANTPVDPWRNRGIGLAVALAIFVIDQGIKIWVDKGLNLYNVRVVEVLPFFDFRWTENYGVSLGLLTAGSIEMRMVLIAFTAAIGLFVAGWMLREKLLGDVLPLALVLGGAAGNIRDRWEHGFVIDYADLHFGVPYFGIVRPFLIFNFADAAITIGVLIILARSLLSREKPDESTPSETSPASGDLR